MSDLRLQQKKFKNSLETETKVRWVAGKIALLMSEYIMPAFCTKRIKFNIPESLLLTSYVFFFIALYSLAISPSIWIKEVKNLFFQNKLV